LECDLKQLLKFIIESHLNLKYLIQVELQTSTHQIFILLMDSSFHFIPKMYHLNQIQLFSLKSD
ncbi:MAG: hypothetical protein ACK55Z_34145, partial [bacterium]